MAMGSTDASSFTRIDWTSRTDLFALSLALSVSSGDASEALTDALAYVLIPRSATAERARWGCAFGPASIVDGVVWPPAPIGVSDMTRVAWRRLLRKELPPPVEARLWDLLLETSNGNRDEEVAARAAWCYLATWESAWHSVERPVALLRAWELMAEIEDAEFQRQTCKAMVTAWDAFANDPTPCHPDHEAVWLEFLDALRADASEFDWVAGSVLRQRPKTPLLEDAWLALAASRSSAPEAPEWRAQRRSLWASAIRDAHASATARAEWERLLRRDPSLLLTLMSPSSLSQGSD
jgi:hypothetical protein